MREAATNDPSLRRRAALALLATAALWGLSFPLNKVITLAHERVAPGASGLFLTVSAIWPRFLIAWVLLVIVGARARGRWTRREVVQGVALALLMSGGLVLQVDGLRFTEASTSAFLSQFFVIVLPVVVFGGQRHWPPLRFVVVALLVLAGVAVLSNVDWRAARMGRGEIETLVSTGFFGVQILLLGHPSYRDNRPVPVTLVMFGVTTVVFFVVAVALAPQFAAVVAPWRSAGWVGFTVLLAIVCTFGAFTLMNTWQPRLNTAEAGLIYSSEPVFASLLALFLPAWFSRFAGLDYANESLTVRLLVGGGLITVANVIIQIQPAAPTPPKARSEP